MDDPNNHQNKHRHFAGRQPAGTEHPVTLFKEGARHVRSINGEETEVLAVGLACSECFSGPNLHRMLKPGFEYERKAMEALANGERAEPLSIHTSAGVTPALEEFLAALEPHLPWKDAVETDDWCVSLQLEGASAVWAAIDMVLQLRILETGETNKTKVAVGKTSYHGPPSTSFGSGSPIWHKHHQVMYPTPSPGAPIDEVALLEQFEAFLADNNDIGVILFEPQWGSSQAGFPWPKQLLKSYINTAKERGIKVVCDEIMCGMGRHGLGTLFVSTALDLNPDALTFGKAIGGGVYPLSGAVIKYGKELLSQNCASVMQSHTYAGSSARALMTATEILKEMPVWLPSLSKLGEEMDAIFRVLAKKADGMIVCHGQGLMWGGLITHDGQNRDPAFRERVVKTFRENCAVFNILPYHVPVGGFMVSPVIDIDVGTLYEMAKRFESVIIKTKADVGWEPEEHISTKGLDLSTFLQQFFSKDDKCLPSLHVTRSCTGCTKFVCRDVRANFISV